MHKNKSGKGKSPFKIEKISFLQVSHETILFLRISQILKRGHLFEKKKIFIQLNFYVISDLPFVENKDYLYKIILTEKFYLPIFFTK